MASGQFNIAVHFLDRHVAEGRGDNIAIECGDEKLSYHELLSASNRVGNALRNLGAGKGERIAIILPDTPEFVMSFLGAIKIGAVALPINTLLKSDGYEYALNDSQARILITNPLILPKIRMIPKERLSHLEHLIVVGEAPAGETSFSKLIEESSPILPLDVSATNEHDPALWLYSSGSTGSPKACVHLQKDMMVAAKQYAQPILGMTEHDRCFSASKLFFAYGLGNSLYFPFEVGATTILMPGPPKPEAVFGTIEHYHPTLFFSVPSHYSALLAYADMLRVPRDLSSVRLFTSAGEQLPIKIFDRFKDKFHVEILDTIGASESFIFISNRPGANRPGSTGQIIPGCEAKILDDDSQPVPPGAVGALFIKSGAICASYWNQPEKTEKAFRDGWFRTGDQYREDADGYFWYVGRSDDMMKCNGAWVSPLEVENVLLENQAIIDAAVVGNKDENGLTKPFAYIVLRGDAPEGKQVVQELGQLCKDRLPAYKRPFRITVVAELPRTTTGKLQRFKLRELAIAE